MLLGHYGSGKSEIAVNLAIQKQRNYLVDLDIVNPYFRSRSARALLERHGVHVVESTIENASGSDLPYISAQGRRPFIDSTLNAVYDLGGSHAGAKLLMQYVDLVKTFDEIDVLLVVNIFRPETANADQIIQLIDTLEAVGQFPITGLINNTNMLNETDEAMIFQGERVLQTVSKQKNIPIRYTIVEETIKTTRDFCGEQLSLTRYLAKQWL